MSFESSADKRLNQHRLQPLQVRITYDSATIITATDLPRTYTSIYNNVTKDIYVNIGRAHNKSLLARDVFCIIGEWVRMPTRYEIHFKVSLSANENSNKLFCETLGLMLEAIALAETPLLQLYPTIAAAKIFIDFSAPDPKYKRTEYWHRLGHWSQVTVPESSVPEPLISEYNEDKPPKQSKVQRNYGPPQHCSMCRR